MVFRPDNILHLNRIIILTGGVSAHPGIEREISHFIGEKEQLHQQEKQLKHGGQEQPPHSDVCPLIISKL